MVAIFVLHHKMVTRISPPEIPSPIWAYELDGALRRTMESKIPPHLVTKKTKIGLDFDPEGLLRALATVVPSRQICLHFWPKWSKMSSFWIPEGCKMLHFQSQEHRNITFIHIFDLAQRLNGQKSRIGIKFIRPLEQMSEEILDICIEPEMRQVNRG